MPNASKHPVECLSADMHVPGAFGMQMAVLGWEVLGTLGSVA